MSYGWAKPGVKCVCVNAQPHPLSIWLEVPLVEGQIYTISAVYPTPPGDPIPEPGVGLEEVPRAYSSTWHGFLVSRFRPLVQQRTEAEDVAQFRHLLDAPADLEAVR